MLKFEREKILPFFVRPTLIMDRNTAASKFSLILVATKVEIIVGKRISKIIWIYHIGRIIYDTLVYRIRASVKHEKDTLLNEKNVTFRGRNFSKCHKLFAFHECLSRKIKVNEPFTKIWTANYLSRSFEKIYIANGDLRMILILLALYKSSKCNDYVFIMESDFWGISYKFNLHTYFSKFLFS